MSKTIKLDIKLDRALLKTTIENGSKKAVFMALDHLASVSKDEVPLDQGPLKNSCFVDVADDGSSGTVSYDTPYAVAQHENRGYHHQRGRKAKYLEDPVNSGAVHTQMIALAQQAMGEDMK